MAVPAPLRSLHKVYHELRLVSGNSKRVSRSDLMKLMLSEARKHDASDERTCRPADELTFITDVYACYLESSRVYGAMVEKARAGCKEKTVQEAARIVGLDLPKNPVT